MATRDPPLFGAVHKLTTFLDFLTALPPCSAFLVLSAYSQSAVARSISQRFCGAVPLETGNGASASELAQFCLLAILSTTPVVKKF